MRVELSRESPPFGVLLTARRVPGVTTEWGARTALPVSASLTLTAPAAICRQLARQPAAPPLLYGTTPLQRTTADHWLAFSSRLSAANAAQLATGLAEFDTLLLSMSFLSGEALSVADCGVWGALYGSGHFQAMLADGSVPPNVMRWYRLIADDDVTRDVVANLPKELVPKPTQAKADGAPTSRKEEGKFVDLPGAEMGKVVVRFPPEASGYLHIGHAKAALLNQYYQKAFQGQLIMRFDDTNPQKEKADFERVILEDLKLLDIQPDRFTHSSDHFDTMLEMCERLLKEGRAYVDDTDPEQMKAEREQMIESKNRASPPEKNLKLWQEMLKGTEHGQKCCVRAKIDMKSPNGCMRDPTIYRCKPETHVRTGDKYKAYPTYDFCCPIVDSIEGVTHALRTTEYHDRDDQYYWFIEALNLRKPYIYEYSRLNMTNTVLSKRKLTWFVDEGYVTGWDDPRFPTVRGILRRGMTVEGLRQFIVAQGSSRAVVFMEWDKIWAFNKKVIDPVAPRYTALPAAGVVPVSIGGVPEEPMKVAKHPKNADVGTKTVWTGPRVLIDSADVDILKEGQNATFINWGNLRVDKVNKGGTGVSISATPQLDNKDYKKTPKLTWLADTENAPLIPTVCVYYDHIISKPVLAKEDDFKQFIATDTRSEVLMLSDPELANVKQSDIIQLQRIGFFICDSPYKPASLHTGRESPCVLIFIPDGHTKETPGSAKAGKAAEAGKSAAAKGGKAAATGKPAAAATAGGDAAHLSQQVAAQGEKVRKLKSEKADKSTVDAEVKQLLALKAQYKAATGSDWKPGAAPAPAAGGAGAASGSAADINSKIVAQGDKVRKLKGDKAEKSAIDAAVKELLALKAEFKSATGQDWKPGMTLPTPSTAATAATAPPAGAAGDLSARISAQGDAVRKLKADKTDKATVDAAVKQLLALKAEFKSATGQDWKPGAASAPSAAAPAPTSSSPSAATDLNQKITDQGNKVRKLKGDKAEKSVIDAAVKELLALKAEFKTATGQDWKPGMTLPTPSAAAPPAGAGGEPALPPEAEALKKKIEEQGNRVRDLKTQKAAAAMVDPAVAELLKLKAEYKTLTDKMLVAAARLAAKKDKKSQEKAAKPAAKQAPAAKAAAADDSAMKKVTRLGLEARKEEALPDWYSQVITKSEMIEYYDVSGCYILRPWSYAIWEFIKDFFDAEIKKLGVENCYFPIFVSQAALEKEKEHIADFAPEVAWVTKSGDSELAEPIAIRPTSETVMYPAYARWIQSHRDLPLKLNQWNNVVRWEFKHPQPFLRTREFLWQEGHTAFATHEEAAEEVLVILKLYQRIYEDLLAIPVVPGRKTEKEKFAGGDYTTTVEAYVGASGRAIQGATSHHLGQNFSKMFDIGFEDPETQERRNVYQNSWGLTTRTLGVMVMVHGDNQGLVLPPRVASIQVVVVPCGITASMSDSDRSALLDACGEYETALRAAGVRARADLRLNVSPGWKFNHWELKGVPLRLELGPRDLKQAQYVLVRRDTGAKSSHPRTGLAAQVPALLEQIHADMLQRATDQQRRFIVFCTEFPEFCSRLEAKCLIQAPFCGDIPCEERIKKESAREEAAEPGAPAMGAKSLCCPFEPLVPLAADARCIYPNCPNKPKTITMFGRSY